MGSPGASDNASGVIVMLLLAELLADYRGGLGIEIVAVNGEDYYSNPGEQLYLQANAGRFDEIVLGINVDDVGYYRGNVAYSLYDCPSGMAASICRVFAGYKDLVEGEPWYQGDHGLFLMNQIPALAITSERLTELMAEITHTPKDRPEIVDCAKLVTVALALRALLLHLDQGVA
jgi:aminopeptidase YwaD